MTLQPTSLEAYEEIKPHLGRLQSGVLEAADQFHDAEFTHQDLINHLPYLAQSTVRTRVKELVRKGLIVDTGKTCVLDTGRRAILWRVTDRGRSVLNTIEPTPVWG